MVEFGQDEDAFTNLHRKLQQLKLNESAAYSINLEHRHCAGLYRISSAKSTDVLTMGAS
jgi:hypothetical protein